MKHFIKFTAVFCAAIFLGMFAFGCAKAVTEDELSQLNALYSSMTAEFEQITQICEEKALLEDGLINTLYETTKLYVYDFEDKIPKNTDATTRERFDELFENMSSIANSVTELKNIVASK